MSKLYINTIGTDILLDTGIDLSDIAVQQIWYRTGAEVIGSWAGSLFSSYSKLAGNIGTYFVKYTLAAGDISDAGAWRFQAYVANTAGTWWGEMIEETVFNELE